MAQNYGKSKDTKRWNDSDTTNENGKSFIASKFKTDKLLYLSLWYSWFLTYIYGLLILVLKPNTSMRDRLKDFAYLAYVIITWALLKWCQGFNIHFVNYILDMVICNFIICFVRKINWSILWVVSWNIINGISWICLFIGEEQNSRAIE